MPRTGFDVTIGQRVESDKNLECSIVIRHKTPSDDEVTVCLLPSWRPHVCPTAVDPTLTADASTGVADCYSLKPIQTVIEPRFYLLLCQFLNKNYSSH